jgi:hypothetical protein
MTNRLPQDDAHTPAPGVVGVDVSPVQVYHLTDVDTQLSKFVVNSTPVARQVHGRPLPPFPHPEGWFQANGSHHGLQPTALSGAHIGGHTRLKLILWRKLFHASGRRLNPTIRWHFCCKLVGLHESVMV